MRELSPLFRVELKKALGRNPWFWGALGIGVFLALYSAAQMGLIFSNTLDLALRYWNESDALYSATSSFASWMPLRSFDFAPGIFLMLWPLLAVIPYAWSWHSERNSGLIGQQVSRASRRACYAAKMTATFVSGALCVCLPFVVNLVANACLAPSSRVWVSDVLYVGVTFAAPFSSLFYTNPLAFCALWTLVAGFVAGLWAMMIGSLSALIGSFMETSVAAYLLLHVLAYVGSQVRTMLEGALPDDMVRSSLLSLNVFEVVSVRSQPDAAIALLVTVGVLVLSSGVLLAWSLRRDVL